MKNLLYIILLLPFIVMGQSQDQNYVKTLTYREATTVSDSTKAQVQISYFDGLGRPIQSVSANAGASGEDIVSHMEYDAYGRQVKEYLPYAIQNNGIITGAYRADALEELLDFYDAAKYENTANPYSEKFLEPSPLNRVMEQAAPGAGWVLNRSAGNYTQALTGSQIYSCDPVNAANSASGSVSIENNFLVVHLTSNGLGMIGSECTFTSTPVTINTPLPDLELGSITNQNGQPTGYNAYIENGKLRYRADVAGVNPLVPTIEATLTADLTWYLGAGHTIKSDYQTNASGEVRKFKVNFPVEVIGGLTVEDTEDTSLATTGFYKAGQLYKSITRDENWTPADGKAKTTEEFKDKEGRVVLKRSYTKEDPTFSPGAIDPDLQGTIAHDTYYVYDDFGNLSYVIPPLASPSVVISDYTATVRENIYPWTRLSLVDQQLADDYGQALENYEDEEILNVDLIDQYGGQGGFSLDADGEGNISLSINIATDTIMPYRTGIIVSLDSLGTFADRELGRIVRNDNLYTYDYYFLVHNNNLEVTGSGSVPSLNVTLTGDTPLEYSRNYPWTKLANVGLTVSQSYENAISSLDNSQILSTYTANTYGAMGGIHVGVDDEDAVTISISISSDTAMAFKQGSVLPLGINRRIANRDLGNVQGYHLSIVDNALFVQSQTSSPTQFTNLNFSTVASLQGNYSIRQEVVEGLCYIYHYDHRNRIIEKHIPDNGWTHMVYDRLDRVILTQNQQQRAENRWLFSKYDALSRVVYTGELGDMRPRDSIQGILNAVVNPVLNEQRHATGFTNGGATVLYTNNAFPTDVNLFTINYFDDYAGYAVPPAIYGVTLTSATTSLPTVNRRRVLGTDYWITDITGFDAKARPLYQYSTDQTYLKYSNAVEMELDFLGNITESKTSASKGAGAAPVVWSTTIVYDYFTYDAMNRPLKHTQKIGVGSELLIKWNKYDGLGQLEQKKVGNSAGANYAATIHFQEVDYTYNIRNWLTGINRISNNLAISGAADLFAFNISYNNTDLAGSTALYNGNIAETQWKTAYDNRLRSYTYSYDALNRLTDASYIGNYTLAANPTQTENYSENKIKYDLNGNIHALERYGRRAAAPIIDKIDILSYTYQPYSNKLDKVSDTADDAGFKNINGTNTDYTYDANGNMLSDANKGIVNIMYNHLNLPTRIDFTGTNRSITYIYDGLGAKLMTQINDTGTVTSRHYLHSFQYENEVLQFFGHPEGYVKHLSGNYTYIYQYKDHLGNTRLSYTGSINPNNSVFLQIVAEDNYYPFGLKHDGYGAPTISQVSTQAQKYKYNGKELQDELGLNMYDYGARNYDPALGRWMNIDPLAEKYYPVSTYNYVANSPIVAIDPDGRSIGITTSTDKEGNTTINVTLTGKVIDLTGDMHVSYLATLKSNLERNFRGSYKNADGTTITVNFIADLKMAETINDIDKNDHVFGIVDGLSKTKKEFGAVTETVGMAQLDGNITLIERGYTERANVDIHETGHLLGLDHKNGTFMNPTVGGGATITDEQRQQMFNRYRYDKNSKYRNSNRDNMNSGDSKKELKNALYDWKAKYNYEELYKR